MSDLGIHRLTRGERITGEAQPTGDAVSAADLLLVLRRQRWPLLLGALTGLILGGLHFATSPAKYYAAAVVLIDERAADPGQEFAASLPVLRNETAALNEMQVLRSLELAKAVVRDLDLHDNPGFLNPPSSLARRTILDVRATISSLVDAGSSPVEAAPPGDAERILAAAVRLRSELGVARIGRSFSIEISTLNHDAALAADIANAYAAAYLAESRVVGGQAAEAGAAWLRRNIDEVRRSADAAAREAAEFRALNRALDPQGMQALDQRVATLNDIHAKLLERLEMVTIEGSYPISNGRLLSEAITPRDPALPKAWRLLSGGLILGLLLGSLVAAWRELGETGLRTGDDVRQTAGVPFLGYLPRFSKRRLRRLTPVVMKPLLLDGVPRIAFSRVRSRPISDVREIKHSDPTRHFAPLLYLPSVAPGLPYNDTLKGLLARTTRMASSEGGCIAAVTSLNSGEGRTTLAANLAQFAALGGLKTLLIDADLSNPALSRDLGFASEPGLADVLAGRAAIPECVTVLPVTGLDVLPYMPQTAPTGHAGILKLADHLARTRERYDLVILDSQPLGASSDVTALLSSLDAVVVVAEWGKTRRSSLKAAMANDAELARKTVGVTLNRTVLRRLGVYGAGLDRSARSARRAAV